MKIRSLILAAATLAIGATLVAAALLWTGAKRSIAADAEQEKTQATMRSIAGLLTLTQEYARGFEPRAAQQWIKLHADLQLRLLAPVLSGKTSAARSVLRLSAAELPTLFDRLTALAAQPSNDFAERRKALLIDQLLARTQELADSAYRWSREAAAAELSARRELRIGGVLALLLLLATSLSLPLQVWRRVLRPLAVLQDAATAIEHGNSAARCNNRARDELGEVSSRFDSMAEALDQRNRDLDRTNRSLDLEVDARRRSQARLQAIADNVPALITHFDAECRYTFVNAYRARRRP